MISAEILKPYKKSSDDYQKTEELKKRLRLLKNGRQPFYLTLSEFEEILRWKLRNQYNRTASIRTQNNEKIIQEITLLALNIKHDNIEYETKIRFSLLMAINGVAVPVASSILALTYPEKYAVIDFRGWRQIFGEEKHYFTFSDYEKYLIEINKLAKELSWLPQEIDLAVWELDRQTNKK